MTIEKYDELQKQSEALQNAVTETFHRAHSQQIFIKSEQVESDAASPLKFECHKCRKKFSSLKEVENHKHHDETKLRARRLHAKSIIDSSEISSGFRKDLEKHDIKYDYNTFTRAFFSEKEKDSFLNPRTREDAKQPPKEPEEEDENISENFMKIIKRNGIEYNVESFQRAFGFSENEATVKKRKLDDKKKSYFAKLEKVAEAKPEAARRRITSRNEVSDDFVKTLEENGISYDLAVFQKAFGYSEYFGDDLRKEQEKSRNDVFKTLRSKGFVKCPNCSCTFTNRSNFQRHMKTHKPRDISLFCEECSKHFKTPACLQIHEATDHGRNNGPVDCPICFKNCPDRGALRSHYYTHKTERSFLCGR